MLFFLLQIDDFFVVVGNILNFYNEIITVVPRLTNTLVNEFFG